MQFTRLLNRLSEPIRIRYLHYSFQAEKAYLHWARFFIHWYDRDGDIRHPRNMGKADVAASLTMLAHWMRWPPDAAIKLSTQ